MKEVDQGGVLKFLFHSFGDELIYPTSFGTGMAEVFFRSETFLRDYLFYPFLFVFRITITIVSFTRLGPMCMKGLLPAGLSRV